MKDKKLYEKLLNSSYVKEEVLKLGALEKQYLELTQTKNESDQSSDKKPKYISLSNDLLVKVKRLQDKNFSAQQELSQQKNDLDMVTKLAEEEKTIIGDIKMLMGEYIE
jgi:hypothetical protein